MAGGGGGAWWIPGVAVQLDFVRRRYYWNGGARQQSDFTAFTLSSGSFGASGLALPGDGLDDVSVLLSTLGISTPCALVVSWTQNATTPVNQFVAELDLDASNYARIGSNGSNRSAEIVTAAAAQSTQAVAGLTVAARQTVGLNIETNNALNSVDGSTGAAADTTVTLAAYTSLRLGERFDNNKLLNGTIHHVAIWSGSQNQTALNTVTAALAALSIS